MKQLGLSLLLIIVAACAGVSSKTANTQVIHSNNVSSLLALLSYEKSDHIMVVAHRGCWSDGAPENSLSAIEECIRLGVDMIEIDVVLTADGVPVLLHDKTLNRTTTGEGNINNSSLADIRQLYLKERAGGPTAKITEEGIPTLEEALVLAKDKILINLDVKGDVFEQAFAIVEKVGISDQILMKMWANPTDPRLTEAQFLGRTLFMPIILECTEDTLKRYCVNVLSEEVSRYRDFEPVAFEIVYNSEDFLAEGVSAIENENARIWVNTLSPKLAGGALDINALEDPDANWGRVINSGVDMIQTDYPGQLLEYLISKGYRSDTISQ